MVDFINSLMLIALGFAPTFVAMEAAWRMGKLIGKRGEKPLCGGKCEMLMYELTSVIVGSTILAGLFVSIAICRPKTIVALNTSWQKIEVRV
jgi:hypothetical protein